MTILYIDNYRGFENEFISLKNVNFFVGENSTGKTSIMSLINLMYSPRFWYAGLGRTDDMNFGLFKDISNHDISNYFKIGLLEEQFNEDTENVPYSGIILKYQNKKGIPKLYCFCYIDEGRIIKIMLNGKRVRYCYKHIDILDTEDEDERSYHVLKKAVDLMDEQTKRDYHYISADYDIDDVIFIINTILMEIKIMESPKNRPDTRTLSFRLPSFIFNITNMGSVEWIAPIRAKPKKTYDEYRAKSTPEGDHAPYILKTILGKKNKKQSTKKDLMDKFGAESGLFDLVEIKSYGNEPGSPFELDIKMGDYNYAIPNVGYGVAQVLPILTGSIFNEDNTCIIIQQPEVHLHPKAQAALGDLFHELVTENKINFMIETHSDFLIDRFRLNTHLNEANKNQNFESQVLFFTREKSKNRVCSIKIEKNGKYAENQPESFRDFFIKEDLSLLEI
ncbi:AAA family ATPase [Methanolobus sp. ZRKC5]|uniref:AAA family ATPase n=1 Tax=unclassified Methanolobus TaxID=2629569 RepID=UPI00313E334A